jgi:hypothetical protein
MPGYVSFSAMWVLLYLTTRYDVKY